MEFATNLKFKCYLFSNLILWDSESEIGRLVGSVIQFVTDCPLTEFQCFDYLYFWGRPIQGGAQKSACTVTKD